MKNYFELYLEKHFGAAFDEEGNFVAEGKLSIHDLSYNAALLDFKNRRTDNLSATQKQELEQATLYFNLSYHTTFTPSELIAEAKNKSKDIVTQLKLVSLYEAKEKALWLNPENSERIEKMMKNIHINISYAVQEATSSFKQIPSKTSAVNSYQKIFNPDYALKYFDNKRFIENNKAAEESALGLLLLLEKPLEAEKYWKENGLNKEEQAVLQKHLKEFGQIPYYSGFGGNSDIEQFASLGLAKEDFAAIAALNVPSFMLRRLDEFKKDVSLDAIEPFKARQIPPDKLNRMVRLDFSAEQLKKIAEITSLPLWQKAKNRRDFFDAKITKIVDDVFHPNHKIPYKVSSRSSFVTEGTIAQYNKNKKERIKIFGHGEIDNLDEFISVKDAIFYHDDDRYDLPRFLAVLAHEKQHKEQTAAKESGEKLMTQVNKNYSSEDYTVYWGMANELDSRDFEHKLLKRFNTYKYYPQSEVKGRLEALLRVDIAATKCLNPDIVNLRVFVQKHDEAKLKRAALQTLNTFNKTRKQV